MCKAVEKLTRDYFYPSVASVVNPSSPAATVDTIPAVVSDRVSSTEEVPDTVETQEEVGLEDYNKDNDNEDDDFKEDIIERDSLVTEENPTKILYPRRPDSADCSNYLRTGTCHYEANSRYDHPARKENQYYLQPGECECEKACRNNHSREKPVVPPPLDFNFLDLPIRPGERECSEYMRDGFCKDGHSCRFHHPDPIAVGEDIPSSSVSLHLSGASLPASTSWSSPPNETVPYLDAANPYVPIMVLPPQGVHPNLDWNGYQGERECKYHVHDGFCKYGCNCRFHRPYPVAVGGGDIPSGPGSLHLSGASQPASASWSPPPNEAFSYLDASNPYVPIMMLPPQGVHPNPEWSGYQASLRHNRIQPLLAANPNLPGWSKPKTHPAVNGTCKGAKKTETVQSLWCEICKIGCTRKDDLDQHKMGKKHKMNLEKLEESEKEASVPPATAAPAAKDPVIGPKENPAADKGKTVVLCAWSEICKIDCSSKDVSDQHKLEKKHKNLGKLEESNKEASAPAAPEAPAAKDPVTGPKESPAADKGKTVVQSAGCEICKIDCSSKDVLDQHKVEKKNKRNLEKLEESKKEASSPAAKDPVIGPKESPAADKGKTVMQSAWCEICMIECTSKDDLYQHKLGKKHKKNIEKLEESQKKASAPAATAPAAKDPVIGPKESLAADKGKIVMQSSWCEMCKIRCTSMDDLDQHKLGKKHKKNLEKLEESKKEAIAPAAKAATAAKDPVIDPKESPAVDKGKTVVQSACCEICMIDCYSKDVLDQHKLGKKHKNLEKLEESKKEASAPAAATAAPAAKHHVIGPKESPAVNEGSAVVFDQHKLGKKHKKSLEKLEESEEEASAPAAKDPVIGPIESPAVNEGKTIVLSAWCEICEIGCGSEVVLEQHKLGKKHKKNLQNLEESEDEASAPAATSASAAKDPVIGPKESPAVGNGKTVVQSAWCEICKIDCKSKVVLEQHKLGKKHKKNLEKSEESEKETSAPAANDPMIGPKESPAANNGKTVGVQQGKKKGASSLGPGEDLVTLRRKLMEGGVEAYAVNVCTICNVVCNSLTDFTNHLAEQNHANLVEETGSSSCDSESSWPWGGYCCFEDELPWKKK
ncbi:uncharacterized protein LOC122670836 [Telopea speciosissima]|uniref:uncharacterized protein LOC122670836 n=1 Tax=Telopea speciosissima TaxID=54955 RepID=UPI001CC424D0|nr:uncharacterized protein LOC122670836 [Telopea speciosissima]